MTCNGLLNHRMDTMQLVTTLTVLLLTLSTNTVCTVSNLDPLGCTMTWQIQEQTVALNGVFIADIKTPDDCQEYCISRPHCVAVEFDYSNRTDTRGCWSHENMEDLKQLYSGDDVRHYEAESSCPERRNGAVQAQVTDNIPPPSAACSLNWKSSSGMFVVSITTASLILANLWKF